MSFCGYTFLSVLAVDLLATSADTGLTWTSPILPKLHSSDPSVNPLHYPITSDEESWIGSLINIGAIMGPLPFGILSEKIGRKYCLLCISIPILSSYIILALVHNIYVYYFARIVLGISCGASCSILPLYISEIAEDSNRGMLSVTLNTFWTFGNLIPYVLGPYLPVMWFNLTLACIPAVFFVSFLIIAPESPYYLISCDKIDKAEEALIKLRSRSRSVVGKEIINIQSSLNKQVDDNGNLLDLLKSKAVLKAVGISLSLLIFQQLSGINAVLFYTQLIFEVSGSHIPAEISSIIIGLVLFSSSLIIPFIADKFGRRFFLMLSSLMMMVALAVLGGYFYVKDREIMDVTPFSWLPILSLVFFIVSFNLGYGPLPWTVASELFPVNIKAFGASLVSFVCWLMSFLVTKFFNNLSESEFLGKAGTFWLFSAFCCLASLFVLVLVPETKGKSFKEIQEILEK